MRGDMGSGAIAVPDTSALLAILFSEPGGDVVLARLTDIRMSSVNLAEAMTKPVHEDRAPDDLVEGLRSVFAFKIVPFDADQAIGAGRLRAPTEHGGLSLGDRACLALAQAPDAPVPTANRAWTSLDVGVEIEVIR
jgi:PIN domain nuclease of toxin-antitoxin system